MLCLARFVAVAAGAEMRRGVGRRVGDGHETSIISSLLQLHFGCFMKLKLVAPSTIVRMITDSDLGTHVGWILN